jgi:hypothetical protein
MWEQIVEVIGAIDAAACRTKVSKEKTKVGRLLYSPVLLNACYANLLRAKGWQPSITRYWVTARQDLIRKTLALTAEQQHLQIVEAGLTPIPSYNQTDFVKDRVAIEVQFGKYALVAYDMFVKHMAFFIGDVIDVGVEVLPMKELQAQMSSGVPYYESGLYDLLRQGRATPAVPMVVIGIAE